MFSISAIVNVLKKKFRSAPKQGRGIGDIFSDAISSAGKEIQRATTRFEYYTAEEVNKSLVRVYRSLENRHNTPSTASNRRGSSDNLHKRSGDLLRSIRDSIRVSTSGSGVTGYIGSDSPYARIHEEGGTVVAKKGKYMTIPLEAALSSNGVPLRKSSRDWKGTFIIESRGNPYIVRRYAGNLQFLYILKESVYIPPRLGLQDAIDNERRAFGGTLVSTIRRDS